MVTARAHVIISDRTITQFRFHNQSVIKNHVSQIKITTEENLFQGRNMTKEFANAYHTS